MRDGKDTEVEIRASHLKKPISGVKVSLSLRLQIIYLPNR